MAIVKMNKFTLLTFENGKEQILEDLQSNSEVEFINLQEDGILENDEIFASLKKLDVDENISSVEECLSKAKSAVTFLKNYVPQVGGLKALREGKESLTLDELKNSVESSSWQTIYSKVKSMEVEFSKLENEKTRLEGEIEGLKYLETFDVPLGELKELKFTQVFLGSIPKQNKEKLIADVSKDFPNVYSQIIVENNQDCYLFMVCIKEEAENLNEYLKSFGYSDFQTKHTGVPKNLLDEFRNEISRINSRKLELKKECQTLDKEKKVLELAYEYYENIFIRMQANKNFLGTDNLSIIQGWTPCNENENIEKIVTSVAGENYYLSFEDVKDYEIADVPIKLENKGPAQAFDSITEMYSLPMYDEIDPTPILTPFYMLFFGVMVADFGYGLVLFLGSILALKFLKLDKTKKAFAKFFMWLSLATCVAGLAFGTAFGFNLEPFGIGIINPSRDTNTLLMLSIGFGVVQILVGLGTKAYMLIRSKQYIYAFYDVGSWLMLLSGLAMLLADGALKMIGIALAIVGSIIIILTQGRAEATRGAQLGQGAYALYGVTSYIGDLVSYTRLMALGVAGGSIAAALNLIIGMLPRGIVFIIAAPLIFVLAHIFNMGLSLLGAYVHTARLQYVEFFSKFYEGGGKAFNPFKTVDNIIDLKKKEIN